MIAEPNVAPTPVVLLVADEPLDQRIVERALAGEFDVRATEDPELALATVTSGMHPDLVLADLDLPGMSGPTLCRRLRALPGHSDLPVILFTAASGPEAEARCLEAGAVDYLAKPVKLSALRARARSQVARKRRLEALWQQAGRDGLTGIANRRWFDHALATSWQRSQRTQQPVSLLLIDADAFKALNDSQGHAAGDEALKRLAAVTAAAARRADDVAARFGGEELALLLPDCALGEAAAIAEQLRAAIEELGIPHPASAHGVVTVSIGVATLVPDGGASPGELVAVADRRLYASKHAGRNRVTSTDAWPAARPNGQGQ